MKHCNYTIERDVKGEPLVIRDLGPWDQYTTVTNRPQEVAGCSTTTVRASSTSSFHGRFGWILKNIHPLDQPLPFKGAQGFLEVPDNLFAT